MRILTVRQPWAWAIIHAGKTVENRSRNIAGDYRGPVLIHVAQAIDGDAIVTPSRIHPSFREVAVRYMAENADPIKGSPWMTSRGHIIGVVDLIDVHSPATDLRHDDFCQSSMGDLCSPWAEIESWHLVFDNPRALDDPIPYKGALGLRKTDFAVIGDYLAAPWGHPNRSCNPYGCEPGCELAPVAKLIPTDITRMEQGT